MATATASLPITETLSPANADEIVELVKACYDNETAVYPVGGGTSLDLGLPGKREGIGVSLARVSSLVDYPARDMTITVGAGITMQALATELAKERQRLPIDVPQPKRATLGGVIATNFNGPRRYGQGTVRDYVIGIQAVDGRGLRFKGGGRVVKNVAGYDFCKLLTGSLGTLGIITEVTLKLKPIPDRLAMVTCSPANLDQAENLLAALVHSQTTPSAVELLAGPAWSHDEVFGSAGNERYTLAVAVEGTELEVAWMVEQLTQEWRELGVSATGTITDDAADAALARLSEFPAGESPLVLKASLAPSGTTHFIAAARKLDGNCSVQAHAGNGIVIVRMSEFPDAGLAKTLIGQLQAAAVLSQGHVVVLSNPSGAEMTHQSVWGGNDAPLDLMSAVKREFDPKDILNPGRFIYLG